MDTSNQTEQPDQTPDPGEEETRANPVYNADSRSPEAEKGHDPHYNQLDDGETMPSAASRAVSGKERGGELQQVEDGVTISTQTEVSETGAQTSIPTGKRRSRARILWIAVSVIGLLAIGAVSAISGYNAGIEQRTNRESTVVAQELQQQFDLGVQNLQEKDYEIARQRFEYILSIAPEYPGAIDLLTEALLALNATATPTVMPTPTLTPTPDLRGVETLFSQAQAAMEAEDWTTVIDNLLALRKEDPGYNTVDVDGMLYISLRNRGVDKILQKADLEGGTYDLALAERFGPLDAEASNYRVWVDLYVTGASFWEIDWGQAVYYFGQLAPMAPGLRDASGWTSAQRYQIALLRFGDFLAQNGDWCQAEEQYQAALNTGADPAVQPTAVYYGEECRPPEPEPRENETEELPQITPTPSAGEAITSTPESYP